MMDEDENLDDIIAELIRLDDRWDAPTARDVLQILIRFAKAVDAARLGKEER